MRALRPDKLTLAALEAVLRLYRDGPARAVEAVPALAMLTAPMAVLAMRAARLRALIEPASAEVIEVESLVGGGSLPGAVLRSHGVALRGSEMSAEALAQRLRLGRPSLIGRIADGRVVLDVRTLAEAEIAEAAAVVRAALAR
jgi:L-seryl-tRNA(Ser) seleniumtransferase